MVFECGLDLGGIPPAQSKAQRAGILFKLLQGGHLAEYADGKDQLIVA